MYVLQIYKDYYPVLGGIEHHVRLLAEGLSRRDENVEVLVTSTDRHTHRERIGGVPVTKTARLADLQSAPLSLAFYPALRRLGRRADVAHLHLPYPPAEIGQLLFGGTAQLVLTYHSDIVRQRVLALAYRPLQKHLLQRARAICISSPACIRTSSRLAPYADKCVVIHHGIDLERFQATRAVLARAAALRSEADGLATVLAVGRLRHYKGIDVLIRAASRLPVRLWIVGGGPMEAPWRALAARSAAAERVTFWGQVPDAELVALYYAADMLALPSTNRAETWGTVQIEAMACGRPVICTELGTGTSYVNQGGVTGLVVPPGDPEALARAIETLAGSAETRQRMGRAARRRAREEMSKEVMVDRTLSLYRALEAGR